MTKKELLERIEKLENQVSRMQVEIGELMIRQPYPVYIPQYPTPFRQPTYSPPIITCENIWTL